MRTCQICRVEKPLTEFYAVKSYICKECHPIITNASRFKQLIKKEGIDHVNKLLIKEKCLLDVKQDILIGKPINESVRRRYFSHDQ